MSQQPTTCPERIETIGPWERKENLDSWVIASNGDRTCSFCGSLHEDDFLDIINNYGRGIEGYQFDPSTKEYKKYARRPGVQNASEGGIKFYMWHMDLNTDYTRKNNIYKSAIARWQLSIMSL